MFRTAKSAKKNPPAAGNNYETSKNIIKKWGGVFSTLGWCVPPNSYETARKLLRESAFCSRGCDREIIKNMNFQTTLFTEWQLIGLSDTQLFSWEVQGWSDWFMSKFFGSEFEIGKCS